MDRAVTAGWDLLPVEGDPKPGSYAKVHRGVWDMYWGLFVSFSDMIKQAKGGIVVTPSRRDTLDA